MEYATVSLPLGGNHVGGRIPSSCLAGVFKPARVEPLKEPRSVLRARLEGALATMRERLGPTTTVAIAVTDRTRDTPNKLILSELVGLLEARGVQAMNIDVIIATGMHAPDSPADVKKNVGEDMVAKVGVSVHNPDGDDLVHVGETSRGTPLWVNRRYHCADLRICTGNIVQCNMAGWTGGAKTVLPGVSGRRTIYANHSLCMEQLLASRRASVAGLLPPANLVRADIEEAGRICGIDFVVNTVLNPDGEICGVFVGNPVDAHRAGVSLAQQVCAVKVPQKLDAAVVAVGSRGFEISLYQGGIRALQNLDLVLKEGSPIVLLCECREGIYEGIDKERYLAWMESLPLPEEICSLTRSGDITPEETPVLWGFSWITKVMKCPIYLVSLGLDADVARRVGMKPFRTLQEALDAMFAEHGVDLQVGVFPYGALTLPSVGQE